MSNFQDSVSGEIDKRKLTKLVDEGAVELSDLANAPIYFMCSCGCEQDINNEVCERCGLET